MQFGAWCIVSSPLILGLDLTNSTNLERVWPIIANREAIAAFREKREPDFKGM